MSDTVIQPRPVGNPLAGQTMSGARMIVQVLADEGVEAIFGYSGGAILPTYDAVFLYNEEQAQRGGAQIPLIVPANEQGAGFMAAGFARATGRVGVCLVTSGPGATNTVTPIRDCMADSVPIVVICGQVARASIGTDAFQEAPVAALMGSVAKHVFLVTDPSRLEATVRSAFELARTGRPGPVVIDIPKDVQNWEGVFQGAGTLPLPGYRRRMKELGDQIIEPRDAERFFEMLGESRRPLIYAGGGVINAEASGALTEFATAFEVPVVTTLMGIGAIDTTHRLSMRMLGMHGAAFANYAVEDCDFLIAAGARFDDRVAGVPAKFARGAKRIAHLDIDRAEINKVKHVQWSHVGLLGEALRALIGKGPYWAAAGAAHPVVEVVFAVTVIGTSAAILAATGRVWRGDISDRLSPAEEQAETATGSATIVLLAAPALLLLAALGLGLVPHLADHAVTTAATFADRRGYATAVLEGRHASVATTTAPPGTLAARLLDLAETAAAVLVGSLILLHARLREMITIATAALRRLHSGHVGDQVTWAIFGLAVLAGLSGLALR